MGDIIGLERVEAARKRASQQKQGSGPDAQQSSGRVVESGPRFAKRHSSSQILKEGNVPKQGVRETGTQRTITQDMRNRIEILAHGFTLQGKGVDFMEPEKNVEIPIVKKWSYKLVAEFLSVPGNWVLLRNNPELTVALYLRIQDLSRH